MAFYNASERLALRLGFQEVEDFTACNHRYFIRDGKKWIHNLEALRSQLSRNCGYYVDDEELQSPEPEGFGYDVEAYYAYKVQSNPLYQLPAFQQLLNQMRL